MSTSNKCATMPDLQESIERLLAAAHAVEYSVYNSQLESPLIYGKQYNEENAAILVSRQLYVTKKIDQINIVRRNLLDCAHSLRMMQSRNELVTAKFLIENDMLDMITVNWQKLEKFASDYMPDTIK